MKKYSLHPITLAIASLGYLNWFSFQFWRFVYVQEVAEKFAESFVEFPPLQAPATSIQ
jgi:arylsulfatase